MRCELCASVSRMTRIVENSLAEPMVPPVTAVCDVCGQPLHGVRDRVMQTLAQLARFGLTGQMLLSRRGS